MKCPYCGAKLVMEPYECGFFDDNKYSRDRYWDEYFCTCPNCEKNFVAIDEYVFVERRTITVEEWMK